MNKFNDLLPLILENKLTQAKDVLNERLYAKLGQRLEESLEEYAPTVFMTKEELEIYEEKKKNKEEDSNEPKPDFLDLNNNGNTEESMKFAADEADDEDDEDVNEDFLNELTAIVEEIETELGEELTEEEIAEIAEELLSEEEKEDDMEDEEDSEDEEESEDMEETCE